MIIDDLNIKSIRSRPPKTNSILVVDAYAELILAITFQLFQSKAFPVCQIGNRRGIGEKDQYNAIGEIIRGTDPDSQSPAFTKVSSPALPNPA